MSRIITAAVALPLIIASILYPPLELLFVAIAVAAISIALYEFWFLARRVGAKPDVVVGYAATAALLVAFFFNWLELLFVIVPLFIIAALAAEMLRGSRCGRGSRRPSSRRKRFSSANVSSANHSRRTCSRSSSSC